MTRKVQFPLNVLEIEKKSANEYHVLVSVVPTYGESEGKTTYRKIRFRDSDFFVDGLEADLAETPIDWQADYQEFFNTGDIDVARAALFVITPMPDQSGRPVSPVC